MGTIASDSIQLESIKDVYDTAEGADTKADTAKATADATAEHFWTDEQGAHITEVDRATFESDPDNAGGNTLITSTGMAIRDGLTDLAFFGSTNAVIGESNSSQMILTASEMKMRTSEGAELFDIEVGSGQTPIQAVIINGSEYIVGVYTTPATEWTFDDSTVGAGSILTWQGITWQSIFGNLLTPDTVSVTPSTGTLVSGTSGKVQVYISTWTFNYGTASNYSLTVTGTGTGSGGSYAINYTFTLAYNGSDTFTASLTDASDTQGIFTGLKYGDVTTSEKIVNSASLTFGTRAGTQGSFSATFGEGLKSPVDNQTVIGAHNIEDTGDDYAFIVGNGTADNSRSNALTVSWAGDVTATGDITAGGDISATGSISGASATLTGTMTVGRDPTSNLEVASKQYVDNSGGGGWTPTFETIRNGISITATSTNYGTNSISLSDYKFIELRLYNSSSMSSNIYPIETVKAQVNNVYINHGQVCRLGSSNVYLTWKYNDDTHLQMNINSGSNMYVGIFGIK